jgi:hypothetical protein
MKYTISRWISSLSFAARLFYLFVFLTIPIQNLFPASKPPARKPSLREQAPRVFLDCNSYGCDQLFFRDEVQFVNWVRDREEAQIHILVTALRTGSGGYEYSLEFLGLQDFEGLDQKLQYIAPGTNTRDETRTGLLQMLKIGLMPYVAKTPLASGVNVSYRNNQKQEVTQEVYDPWNYWVFDVDFGGWFNKEESKFEYNFNIGLSADRITETWRVRSNFYMSSAFDKVDSGENQVNSRADYRTISGSVVRSLTEYWSTGVFLSAYHRTNRNTDLNAGSSLALEYSIFPYGIATKKELTLAYYIGPRHVRYIEETLFDKTQDNLFRQSLSLRLRITQPWGSAFAYLTGGHYFHDISKNSVNFSGYVNFRVFKGLSFRLRLGAELIHDQLYLEKGEASLEDILLNRKQLATAYELNGSIGFSYTFGSIYNNIVNTRL